MPVNLGELQQLIGKQVVIRLKNEMYGVTLRWGVLTGVENDTARFDDYRDSAGIGAHIPGRGCNVHDDVPEPLSEIVGIEEHWPGRC